MLGVGRDRRERADEIRTARPSLKSDLLDFQLRVCGEELRQHALHLHPRREAVEGDAGRGGSLQEGEHVCLELGMCRGGVEVGEQVGHRVGRDH